MTPLLNNIYAVQVPDGAKNFLIVGNQLRWKTDPLKFWWDLKPLPPGNWQILFATKGASDEDWIKIVGKGKLDEDESEVWYNSFDENMSYNDPAESGHSLLRSRGLNPENNHLLIERV